MKLAAGAAGRTMLNVCDFVLVTPPRSSVTMQRDRCSVPGVGNACVTTRPVLVVTSVAELPHVGAAIAADHALVPRQRARRRSPSGSRSPIGGEIVKSGTGSRLGAAAPSSGTSSTVTVRGFASTPGPAATRRRQSASRPPAASPDRSA